MHKFSWISFGRTHTGKKRKINQDAFVDLPDKLLWVVADGMGGHKAGELASSAIVDAMRSLTPEKSLGATVKQIYRELHVVNRQLLELAAAGGENELIGSTVVVLTANFQHCVYLWSGDSRIYLFRQGSLKQLSRDHNCAANLRASGLESQYAEAHPYAQSLSHAVGGEPELYLEAQIQEIRTGDIFLLCSDGLNKEVSDAEIEAIFTASSIEKTSSIENAVNQLMETALSRGARDNVTVVLAQALSVS